MITFPSFVKKKFVPICGPLPCCITLKSVHEFPYNWCINFEWKYSKGRKLEEYLYFFYNFLTLFFKCSFVNISKFCNFVDMSPNYLRFSYLCIIIHNLLFHSLILPIKGYFSAFSNLLILLHALARSSSMLILSRYCLSDLNENTD